VDPRDIHQPGGNMHIAVATGSINKCLHYIACRWVSIGDQIFKEEFTLSYIATTYQNFHRDKTSRCGWKQTCSSICILYI